MPHGRCAVLLALLAILFLGMGCNNDVENPDANKPAPAGSPAYRVTLGGAGSTFIDPLMKRWIADYGKTHPDVRINYRPIGSGKGIEEFQAHLLEFGTTDAPLSDEQLGHMFPTVQIPVTAGPVCIIYNLPGLSSPLRLSANSLAGIYLGNIVSWQDPSIARDNPGAHLPKAPVIVVHRADGSGTTNIFTTYLSKVSPEWSQAAGHGTSITWPTGLAANGSQGVVDLLKQTVGTIGYAELNYANANKLAVVSVQNRSGAFQPPSPAAAAAAINAFQEALATEVRTPIVDPPSIAKDAYPISGFSFLLLPKDGAHSGQAGDLEQFVDFILGDGQNAAEALSYSSLPESLKQVDLKLLNTLRAAMQPGR